MTRKTAKILAAAVGLALIPALGSAQEKTLTLWSHVVHQQVVEGQRGGAEVNLGKAFTDETGIGLDWVTIAFDQMQDKIVRELNLSSSQADIVFVLNTWANRGVLNRLQAFDSMMEKQPIAAMDELSPGMLGAFTDAEGLKGIPIRHNPQLMHFNKQIFEQQGITEEPQTVEALVDAMRKATHKREDGATVYGFAFEGNQLEDLSVWVRAYGGEIIATDLTIGANTPEAIAAISALRDLYAEGVLPPNLSILTPADLQNLMSQGLIAMGIFGDNYYDRFNDPENSQVAGDTWFMPVPTSEANDKAEYASSAGFWVMGIPKNSDPDMRDAAWDFITFLSRADNQFTLAMNNNSPILSSIYSTDEYAAKVPYAEVVQKVLPVASPPMPAFTGSREAERIFLEEALAAITGAKSVEDAMADAQDGIEDVLKREGLK